MTEVLDEALKTCTRCGEVKPLGEFHRRTAARDGRHPWCKICVKQHQATPAGRASLRAAWQKWQAANPDRIREINTRPETRERKAAWARAHRDDQRAYQLKKRFRLTPDDYDQMFAAQNGVCAICHQPPGGRSSEWLDVDHDHACCPVAPTCGRCVRGLLCNSCNRRLGRIEAGEERPSAPARAYLEAHK